MTTAEAKISELQETHKRELAKAYERGRKRSERRLPDGTVEITEEEIERSTESAREEARRELREHYEAEVKRAADVIYDLRAQVRQLETETVKAAPRWAAALGWDPLANGELGRWRVGLGINLGPLTGLATAAPAALATGALTDTRPQLEAILRF
jgi:hypothetical protein